MFNLLKAEWSLKKTKQIAVIDFLNCQEILWIRMKIEQESKQKEQVGKAEGKEQRRGEYTKAEASFRIIRNFQTRRK